MTAAPFLRPPDASSTAERRTVRRLLPADRYVLWVTITSMALQTPMTLLTTGGTADYADTGTVDNANNADTVR